MNSNEKNITRQEHKISRNVRAEILKQRGMVLWFTGLSGAGKSTIACEVENALMKNGKITYLLDGDNVRYGLNSDLGFSNKDRNENIRRISEAAALFADAGIITLVSVISPFKEMRNFARKVCGKLGAFVEIYVKAELNTCIKRDPKGLYRKALDGTISEFTGISSPYEEPEAPEIIIDTDSCSPSKAVEEILEYINIIQNLDKITEFTIKTAVEAGKVIMDVYQRDFDVAYKDDRSPLTEADLMSDKLIRDALTERYSEYAVLSEETADDFKRLDNKYCFIVDPLDGTKEFVKKNGEFTVNIAFSYNHKTIMGVILSPALNKLYYAAKGLGSYCENVDEDLALELFSNDKKLNVSRRIDKLIVLQSRSHANEALIELLDLNDEVIGKTISAGSSLKGCLIAEGSADIYYRTGPTCEWDTAAMQCIVEEAGGVFLQLDSTQMFYNRKNTLNDKGFFILNRIENKFKTKK
ncbi:MAG: inositol monophosphatase [Clostridia bacterium]|nr:inositol monophosphatase [Clostridia bacterium]